MKRTLPIFFLLMCGLASQALGQGTPLFHWRSPQSAGAQPHPTFNHNPSTELTGGAVLTFDSIPYAEDYTMIAVYRTAADTEAAVWRLQFSDSTTTRMRGLTTERLLSDSLTVRYADRTDATPAINTVRQSAGLVPSGTPSSPQPAVRLAVGGSGTLQVAEVRYYDGRMGNAALRRVQSALAIRYGITLGPVSYVDSRGRHVWDYTDSGQYHHRVTGVGVDSLSGLNQRRSRSEMGGAVLTLWADSLCEGMYLLAGDDDGPMAFADDGLFELLARRWRVQSTATDSTHGRFTLRFDLGGAAVPGDSLVLMADGIPVRCAPVDADGGVLFGDVTLPDTTGADDEPTADDRSHVHTLALGRGAALLQLARGTFQQRTKSVAGAVVETRLYPNPSNGRYTLEVNGAERVEVTIHNTQGMVVATHRGTGPRCRFEGHLPTGNAYYATVTTEKESQTLKLVVR